MKDWEFSMKRKAARFVCQRLMWFIWWLDYVTLPEHEKTKVTDKWLELLDKTKRPQASP